MGTSVLANLRRRFWCGGGAWLAEWQCMRQLWVALTVVVLAACSFDFPATGPVVDTAPPGDTTVTDTTVVPPLDMAPPVDAPADQRDEGGLQQCGNNFIVNATAVSIACVRQDGVATCTCKRLGQTFQTCTSTAEQPCELPTCCNF
jgi:hypothetical protein